MRLYYCLKPIAVNPAGCTKTILVFHDEKENVKFWFRDGLLEANTNTTSKNILSPDENIQVLML